MAKNKISKNTQSLFPKQLANYINSIKLTSVTDLSDYYSKISTLKDNFYSDVKEVAIDPTNKKQLLIANNNVIKEYLSKNEPIYGTIFKNSIDSKESIIILHCYQKTGNNKMTNAQLYSLLSKDIENIKVNMVTKSKFKKEIARLDNKIDTKFNELDQKFDAKITALDQKFDTKITALDQKFDAKITALDQKFDTKINELDQKIDTKFNELDEKINKLKKDNNLK